MRRGTPRKEIKTSSLAKSRTYLASLKERASENKEKGTGTMIEKKKCRKRGTEREGKAVRYFSSERA